MLHSGRYAPGSAFSSGLSEGGFNDSQLNPQFTNRSSNDLLTSPGCERFEYKEHTLISYHLEQHLALHPLVNDSTVVAVPGGPASASSAASHRLSGIAPTAFVVLSPSGRDRASKGGEKESKRMKTELLKWLVDLAPPFKQMNGKLHFVECIPRSPDGSVVRRALVDKVTSPPASAPAGPSKGFFSTVMSESSTAELPASAQSGPSGESSAPKKVARDSKRRATHSQIERRRREKINDRLITLRSIVPACAKELQDRLQQRQDEEREAARIAAGGAPKTIIDAVTGKPKRKRNRKKPDAKKAQSGAGAEEELGLHKLEVLTHAINHIFELKARIHYLETGVELQNIPTAENPFGFLNPDDSRDVKVKDEPEDESMSGNPSSVTSPFAFSPSNNKREASGRRAEEDDDAEEEEEDEEDEIDDDDDDDYDFVDRLPKKHNPGATHTVRSRKQPGLTRSAAQAARRQRPNQSSSSSRDSEEVSPIFPLQSNAASFAMTPGTSVSSPLMSLSAESPIFLSEASVGSKHRNSQSMSFLPLPASAMPLPASHQQPSSHLDRRESSSFLFKQLSLTSPNFAPFNQHSYPSAAAARSRSSTFSFPSYGADSEVRDTPSLGPTGDRAESESKSGVEQTPGLSDRHTQPIADPVDASAAALLLNFSTSPEVLRPVGSSKPNRSSRGGAVGPSTNHARPVVGLGSRGCRSVFTSPQYRPLGNGEYSYPGGPTEAGYFGAKNAAAFRVPGSAPGGTSAIEKQEQIEDLDLGSPSHLVLDASSEEATSVERNRPEPLNDDADPVSDATLEDIPLTAS